jgi:hypothetical protein
MPAPWCPFLAVLQWDDSIISPSPAAPASSQLFLLSVQGTCFFLSADSLAACHLACLSGREAQYLCASEAQVCVCHSHSGPPAGILAEGGLGMGSTGETGCGIIKREQKQNKTMFSFLSLFLPLALIIFPLLNSTSTLIKLASGREVWQTWRSSLVYFLITQRLDFPSTLGIFLSKEGWWQPPAYGGGRMTGAPENWFCSLLGRLPYPNLLLANLCFRSAPWPLWVCFPPPPQESLRYERD